MTSTNNSHRLQKLGTLALITVAYFAITIIVLHFLRPDLNPVSQPTSEYAVGRYGFLMTSAFFSMSVATFALVIGLFGVIPSARSWIGMGLLALWGIGVLVAMSFPISLEGSPPTLSNTIHRTSGPLAFLSLTAGVILISRRLKYDENWRPLHKAAVTLSLIILAGFIGTFLSFVTSSGFLGLAQRITLAAAVTWISLTAGRLRSIASSR